MTEPAPDRESPDTLGALAAAAAGGDSGATAELLARVEPKIVRYCRARIGAAHGRDASADDVAQEALLGVLSSLPRYRASGANFLAFAYGIAANKVADFHRRHASNPTQPVAELPESAHTPDTGPEHQAVRAELREEVGRLLRTLTDYQREILVLRVAVGLSAAETARALSTSPSAVRIAQHRALNRLRAEIARASGAGNPPLAAPD
ncbi:RNA polymerase sigma factor ShbA [Haloechinothrix sp. LS1_15]|uniref:RNA polymerase sigma factor ShbA n=1 Tax=Haloechinothrix sp. LS1_15 TaxID=2652248 RepID=UPI002944EEAD|nr:RNA polymerase sigma factor ShbA [Haloechinothrix sp. LS1_15]MDV6012282.1 sigma-70 family RNA polymerase sigma factor [Haloechinothrix sp. LS1_15]